MQAMILRLESFDRPAPPAAMCPQLTADDLDQAYQRGRADGRSEAAATTEARLASLFADALAIARAQQADMAAQARRAQTAAGPVIEALLNGVMPALVRARLQAALMAELGRLVETGHDGELTLICDAQSAPFLAACAERVGIADVHIVPTAPDGRIEIALDPGQVVFDHAATERELATIIADALKGE